MNARSERRLLLHMVARIDSPSTPVFASRWFLPVAWLGLVIVITVLLATAGRIGIKASALAFGILGFAAAYLFMRSTAATCWPVLAPHFNRQGLVDRIDALDP